MQLLANPKLVRTRVRLGGGLYLAAMGMLVLGLFVSNSRGETNESVTIAWSTMIIGMGLWFVGIGQLRRWGPRQRQETKLAESISDLDDRYKLYAYISSSLPDYILVSPAGVNVLVTRSESGDITAQAGDEWMKGKGPSILGLFAIFDAPFGNPSAEAGKQVEKIRQLLSSEGIEDVPVAPLIVFTDEKVRLQTGGSTVPVAKVKGLKDVLRRSAGKGKSVALTTGRIREVQAIFDRRMEGAGAWR